MTNRKTGKDLYLDCLFADEAFEVFKRSCEFAYPHWVTPHKEHYVQWIKATSLEKIREAFIVTEESFITYTSSAKFVSIVFELDEFGPVDLADLSASRNLLYSHELNFRADTIDFFRFINAFQEAYRLVLEHRKMFSYLMPCTFESLQASAEQINSIREGILRNEMAFKKFQYCKPANMIGWGEERDRALFRNWLFGTDPHRVTLCLSGRIPIELLQNWCNQNLFS
jgi:hypothetical protein